MKKKQVIDSLGKSTYTKAEVVHLLTSVTGAAIPSTLKKGDIIVVNYNKRRPAIVIKVIGDVVYSVTLTSSENEFAFTPYSSRFLGSGFISSTIITCTIEQALENFVGVFDSPKQLNKVIKELKEYYLTKVF